MLTVADVAVEPGLDGGVDLAAEFGEAVIASLEDHQAVRVPDFQQGLGHAKRLRWMHAPVAGAVQNEDRRLPVKLLRPADRRPRYQGPLKDGARHPPRSTRRGAPVEELAGLGACPGGAFPSGITKPPRGRTTKVSASVRSTSIA